MHRLLQYACLNPHLLLLPSPSSSSSSSSSSFLCSSFYSYMSINNHFDKVRPHISFLNSTTTNVCRLLNSTKSTCPSEFLLASASFSLHLTIILLCKGTYGVYTIISVVEGFGDRRGLNMWQELLASVPDLTVDNWKNEKVHSYHVSAM